MLHLRECHSDYVTAPGDTLHETLATIGMSQTELAQRTGYSEIMVEGVIRGKRNYYARVCGSTRKSIGRSGWFLPTLR